MTNENKKKPFPKPKLSTTVGIFLILLCLVYQTLDIFYKIRPINMNLVNGVLITAILFMVFLEWREWAKNKSKETSKEVGK